MKQLFPSVLITALIFSLGFLFPCRVFSQDTLKAIVHTKDSFGIPSDTAIPLFSDPRGNVWIIFQNKGLGIFDRNKWTFFDTTNGLLHDTIMPYSCFIDSAYNVWITYPLGGWSVFNGRTWKTHPLPPEAGLPYKFKFLFSQKNGNVWFLCDTNGIGYYNGDTWTHFSTKNGLASNVITETKFDDKNNKIWVVYQYKGVGYYDGNTWHNFLKKDGLSNDTGYSLTINFKGQAFIAHSSKDPNFIGCGYSYFNGQTWSFENTWAVSKSIVDALGDFWFSFPLLFGDYFIGRIHDGVLTKFTDSTTNSHFSIQAFYPAANGSLWVIYTDAAKGTAYFDGQIFHQFNKSFSISTMDNDSKGNTWGKYFNGLGTDASRWFYGVCRFNGTEWVYYTTADGLSSNGIYQYLHDNNGNTFVRYNADNMGLGFFNGSTWSNFSSSNGLLSNTIPGFFTDYRGNVWVDYSTNNKDLSGVGCFFKNKWVNFSKGLGNIPSNGFINLTPLRNGEVWGWLDSAQSLVQFTTDSLMNVPVRINHSTFLAPSSRPVVSIAQGVLIATGFATGHTATVSLLSLNGRTVFRTGVGLSGGNARLRFPDTFKHQLLIVKFEHMDQCIARVMVIQ